MNAVELIMLIQIESEGYRIVSVEMELRLERQQESGWEFIEGEMLSGSPEEFAGSIGRLSIAAMSDANGLRLYPL